MKHSSKLLYEKNLWFLLGYFVNDGYLNKMENYITLHIYGGNGSNVGSYGGKSDKGYKSNEHLLKEKLISLYHEISKFKLKKFGQCAHKVSNQAGFFFSFSRR